jgi:hypothetical protein
VFGWGASSSRARRHYLHLPHLSLHVVFLLLAAYTIVKEFVGKLFSVILFLSHRTTLVSGWMVGLR